MTDPVVEPTVTPTPEIAPVTEPVAAPAAPEPSADYAAMLSEIKNPTGEQKYASVAQALTSVGHKDTHISTLEKETETLRAEVAQLKAEGITTDELLSKIKDAQQAPAEDPAAAPAMDAETLDAMIDQRFARKDTTQRLQANVDAMDAKLLEKFGSAKAVMEALNTAAANYGMSAKGLLELGASRSPNFVYAAVGMVSQPAITPNPIVDGGQQPVTPNVEKPLSGRELFEARVRRPSSSAANDMAKNLAEAGHPKFKA